MNTFYASRLNWTVTTAIACALVVFAVGNPSLNGGIPINEVEGDEAAYSLTFSETNNHFSDFTSDNAITAAGAPISFSYSGLSPAEGKWGIISPFGDFLNTTPISGIHSITFSFGNTNGISLSYGWVDRGASTINYRVTDVLLDSLTPSYSFRDLFPDCIKITNTNLTDVEIISFSVSYSCSPISDPYYAIGTDGLEYIQTSTSSYGVKRYNGTTPDVVIPSKYMTYDVTSIADSAFQNCANLNSVIIPTSVVTIGNFAFMGSSLPSVSISANIISIGEGAFAQCLSLTSISVSSENLNYSSVNGNLYNYDKTTIISYAIGKTELSFTIPYVVTHIGNYAFSSSPYLTFVEISSSVTIIDSSAFKGCIALSSINIPISVVAIGSYVFENAAASLIINCEAPSEPTTWDPTWNVLQIISSEPTEYTYHTHINFGWTYLTYELTLDGNSYIVTGSIGTISLIEIPSKFNNKNVTEIQSGAFVGNTDMTSITIPSTITLIGDSAFLDCTSLTSFIVDSNNSYYSSLDGVLYDKNQTQLIIYPSSRPATSFEIPNSVTVIGNEAFVSCELLTSITIPIIVSSIGSYAFAMCTSLTSIYIPSSVITIGSNAFLACDALTINCQATSLPVGWDADWNPDPRPVTWAA